MLTAFVMCVTFFLSAQGVTITYDLNGGELSNGANSYQADSNNNNNAVLDNPTKTGYIFTGWCDTNDYTAATNTCSNRVGLVTTNNNNATKTMVRWTVPNDLSTDTTFIAMWEEDKFQVTTMNISANDYFGFALGAFGTFWVDWGDGNVEYITQTRCSSGCDAGATNWMGNATVYSHTYATSGVYTVRFGGLATGYKGGSFNDNTLYNSVSAINFGYRAYITGNSVNEGISVSFDYDTHVGKKIVGISGSLGALFPTISGYDTYNISTNLLFEVQPMFIDTFYGCNNLTGQIPAGLFSGVTGKALPYMFYDTFFGCSGLTSYIPPTLFYDISTETTPELMTNIFYNTGLLTYCPSGMSQYITGFESYFDSRVSCMQTDRVLCPAGQTLVGTSCTSCLDPNNCPTEPTQFVCPNGYLADSAHAECRTAYTITYNLDGGVWPNNNTPASAYLPGVGYNLCDIPVKPGYFFNGWRDENNNWSYCIEISAQDTGNKTFYAQLALITQLCEAGQYLYIGAEYGAWCEPCLDGYYCPGGSDLSINNTGLYSCSSGSHPACECNIGDYYDYAQGTCKSCPTGHVWDSKEGACVCDKGNGYTCCDAGEYLEYVDKGGSGYYSCNKCDEGNYCEGGAWLESELNGSSVGQIPCAINTVAPDGNMSACISCGEHGYTNGTGESECICDTGYGWSAKTQSCISTSCPTGHVWDSKEEACVCDKGNGYTCCDAGAYLYYESGKNDYYCDKCPSGSYCEGGAWTSNDLSGSSVGIETCPSGSTSDYNSSVCVCDSGTWDTTNHTCSGGSSTFTCESNTWLHVGNEQICTYATKTTDRALAIRVDANHVYYVMLTPASENDYPIHAGSNYKLKIREYNAAGTESTIYNAHDMSVVSE